MKISKIRIATVAHAELLEAGAWYEEQSALRKSRFVADYRKALNLILHYPKAWPQLHGRYRKCRLSRFPYLVIYYIQRNQISIVAMMHAKQKPNYWLRRPLVFV